jgi:hypothetical protein
LINTELRFRGILLCRSLEKSKFLAHPVICAKKNESEIKQMFVEIDENKFVNLGRVFAVWISKTDNHYVCRFHIGEGLEETSRTFETQAEASK